MSQRRSTPALAFVLVALLASGASAQSRVAFARVELSGPMSTPSLALLEDSPTHLAGALLAGERIERVLPVVVGEGPLRGEPRWRWEGDPERAGRARFLGWSARADESWSALPAGLRARPRPPAEPQHRAPPFALACVLAGLALASAALAWWIAGAGRPESAGELRVLEG